MKLQNGIDYMIHEFTEIDDAHEHASFKTIRTILELRGRTIAGVY